MRPSPTRACRPTSAVAIAALLPRLRSWCRRCAPAARAVSSRADAARRASSALAASRPRAFALRAALAAANVQHTVKVFTRTVYCAVQDSVRVH
jgi:hypothetical protein